jgi:hypothetical protein
MLIHVTPRIYIPFRARSCEITELTVAELGISLTKDELVARQPCPNKLLFVASRRKGRKAISGLFFETSVRPAFFSVEAKWVVNGTAPVTHVTHYAILDQDNDCVTDNMMLWYGAQQGGRKWEDRWAEWAKDLTPARAMPVMELLGAGPLRLPTEAHRKDLTTSDGNLTRRTEQFSMHTVESERLIGPWGLASNPWGADRLPEGTSAFQCQISAKG